MRFKLYQDQRTASAYKGKWYARALHEAMTFEEFINHMATHHCAFSEATIRGVLIEMETCLRELLLEGKAVRLDELGIFRIGIRTSPADSARDFNVAQNVPGVRLNLYLGRRFRPDQLRKDIKLHETEVYTVDKSDTTEGGTGGSGTSGSGTGGNTDPVMP